MKRLYLLLLILLLGLSACGRPGSDRDGAASGQGEEAAQGADSRPTATKIVLATPTPKPPPPTPTPRPTPTPTAEMAAEQPAESDEPPVEAAEAGPVLDTEMMRVPAGEFTIGVDGDDPENGPARVISLPAFEIDRFEVTNEDFAKFVEATGYVTTAETSGSQSWRRFAEGRDNHPVVKVTWDDAVAFCEWAGKRLPTEEEWEKAARGPDGRTYPWGDTFDPTLANVKETAIRGTTAVGSFPGGASPYGVEDLGGNVWEWTASWFKAYPGNNVQNQYFGERFRVTRGGAWFEEAPQVAAYNRNAADPAITANDDLGFRCVRDVTE